MDLNERRTLGRTGLRVCRLGLAAGYGVPGESVEKAYHEYGVNYFYWAGRKSGMQTAMHNLAPKHREDLVIAVQSHDRLGWFLPGSVEKALLKAKLDYFDVMIFGYFGSLPRRRVIDAARKLVDEQKVRFLGLSGHKRSFHGEMVAKPDSPIDVHMLRYNAAHRGAENEIFGRINKENPPGITTYTATRWRKLLKASKMPPGQKPLTAPECYRFVLAHPAVDVCLTGPATKEQMDETLTIFEQGPLSEEEMERIRRIGDHVHG